MAKDWLETLPYFRRKAVHCMRSGWTREQATGRNSEYGWTRSLHSVDARPLATLVSAERRIRLDEQAERDAAAAINNHRLVMGMFNQLLGRAA